MTTTEKNKCIAEMLGWKVVKIPVPDFDNKVASSPYRVMEDRWEHPVSETLYKCLKFDTDANWQFEALDFIEKLGNYSIGIDYHSKTGTSVLICTAWEHGVYSAFIDVSSSNKKEAVFEALYQFSQYIKGNGSK